MFVTTVIFLDYAENKHGLRNKSALKKKARISQRALIYEILNPYLTANNEPFTLLK